jgi:hypothetical protein
MSGPPVKERRRRHEPKVGRFRVFPRDCERSILDDEEGTSEWGTPMPDDAGPALARIFVGCATGPADLDVHVADKMQTLAARQVPPINLEACSWQYTFKSGDMAYERLLECVDKYEFGVFIFTPDDRIERKGEKGAITRDNVIFELGLWAGAHGRDHAHVLRADTSDLNLLFLTDLDGFVTEPFAWTEPQRLQSLGAATDRLFTAIVGIARRENRRSEDFHGQMMTERGAAELLLLQQLEAKLRAGKLKEGRPDNLKPGLLVISQTYGLGEVVAVGDQLVRVHFSKAGAKALLHNEVALAES